MSDERTRSPGTPPAVLAEVGGEELEHILHTAVDVTLILDEEGRVLETLPGRDASLGEALAWEGSLWADLVTGTTRPKVEALIEEGFAQGVSRFRQVNHLLRDGTDVPLGFTTIRMGGGKRLIAVGRSLQALAELQRRLVEAQQTMESEYWHVRQAEARYRLLFHQSSQPIFLVDAETLRITDANNAGGGLMGTDAEKLVGRPFPLSSFSFSENGAEAAAHKEFDAGLRQVLSGAASTYRTRVRVGEGDFPWVLTLSLVRFAQDRVILARLESERAHEMGASGELDIMDLLDRAPDGFVVTDLEGTILLANEAFVALTQVQGPGDLEGRNIGLWFGRPGADLTVLKTQLERSGQIRHFHTTVQGEHGLASEVEISAVASSHGGEVPAMALVFRDVTRRMANGPNPTQDLNTAVERLTSKVGQVALKDLVDDTVSLVELHFIDAALQLTGDNRSAAASLLGLSRQSLYTKIRRYGLDRPDAGGN